MNTWQLCREIKSRLQAQNWLASSSPVFASGSVFISAGSVPDEQLLKNRRTPMAMISPMGGTTDPDYRDFPGVLRRDINIRLIVTVAGDALGESCLMGAHPTSDTSAKYERSHGRGILEVEEELLQAVEYLGRANGVEIQLAHASSSDPRTTPDGNYSVTGDYTFESWVTAERTYPPGDSLSAAGQVFTWVNPPTRFDLYKMVLRSSSGAAPATITDGDDIPITGGNLGTTATSSLSSGTYNCSLFATYDDFNSPLASSRRSSDPVSVAITVA